MLIGPWCSGCLASELTASFLLRGCLSAFKAVPLRERTGHPDNASAALRPQRTCTWEQLRQQSQHLTSNKFGGYIWAGEKCSEQVEVPGRGGIRGVVSLSRGSFSFVSPKVRYGISNNVKEVKRLNVANLAMFFSCPGQLNRWHCHWLSEWVSDTFWFQRQVYFSPWQQ